MVEDYFVVEYFDQLYNWKQAGGSHKKFILALYQYYDLLRKKNSGKHNIFDVRIVRYSSPPDPQDPKMFEGCSISKIEHYASNAGYYAYENGISLKKNPFNKETQKAAYQWWRDGYHAAKKHNRMRKESQYE